MAYSDYTQFPRGRKVVADLGSTPVELFGTTTLVKITHIVLAGGAADRLVTFRAVDNSPEIVRVDVPAGETVVIPGWNTDKEGVEVLTDNATTDVDLTAFTVEPTIA